MALVFVVDILFVHFYHGNNLFLPLFFQVDVSWYFNVKVSSSVLYGVEDYRFHNRKSFTT